MEGAGWAGVGWEAAAKGTAEATAVAAGWGALGATAREGRGWAGSAEAAGVMEAREAWADAEGLRRGWRLGTRRARRGSGTRPR